ncbi:MAG: 30S ribosomal protein S2 [Alphaproteobacteria bacterium GM202ARS2]|nr:30S ribosomal protein S2 [Alphaproteobacteria bacterium GM202ARS2]
MSGTPQFTMRQLLEAGVHFGHRVRRWNPRMEPYIYGKRQKTHIIDLQKTVTLLRDGLEALRQAAARGQRILFVGTKRRASAVITAEAQRCRQYYVNYRWLGGMLTNWGTVSASIDRLRALEKALKDDNDGHTKKERLRIEREHQKLERAIGGIKDMGNLPAILFVIDTVKENIAVQEAYKLGIPVVAVLDSNADPTCVTYPIPGNDDSLKAIRLYARLAADAVLQGLAETEAQRSKDESRYKKNGAGDSTPADSKKADSKKTDSKKADSKKTDSKKADSKSADGKKAKGDS